MKINWKSWLPNAIILLVFVLAGVVYFWPAVQGKIIYAGDGINGRVMFEMAGVSEDVAREALRLASAKLPIKCKIYNKAQLEAKLAEKEGGEAK